MIHAIHIKSLNNNCTLNIYTLIENENQNIIIFTLSTAHSSVGGNLCLPWEGVEWWNLTPSFASTPERKNKNIHLNQSRVIVNIFQAPLLAYKTKTKPKYILLNEASTSIFRPLHNRSETVSSTGNKSYR